MTQITHPRIGEAIEIHLSARYYQFNRSFAIRDVYDALVELITNCDDSYHRLSRAGMQSRDGGPIAIEYLAGKNAMVAVYDRAEGMTLAQMQEKLADVGTRRSGEGDRGFMARGAKDCTELGSLIYESVKDDRYYKCELTTKPQFVPLASGERVTSELRSRMRIGRGNGTVVTLKLNREQRLPRFESLVRELPWHFALRDILAETSPTQVQLTNLNNPELGPERIVYRRPVGEFLFRDEFDVPGYPTVRAKLEVARAPEALEDPSDRFRRSGFVIKGSRAIHDCTLFLPEFEKDPLAKRYFGRLECAEIDRVMIEYDERREKGEPHPSENPSLLIDPNRQHGLRKEHPFTKGLFLTPSERLRALIAADREREKSETREVANHETKNRLDRLAKRASEFLRQQIESEELTDGDDVDKTAFKHGTMIFPTYLNVALGQERALTYYVKAALLDKTKPRHTASASSDDPALIVLDPNFEIRPHKTKEDRFSGTFRVRGTALKDSVILRANFGGLVEAQAVAAVVEDIVEEHTFEQPLEFEFGEYKVREGSRRSMELFAKYPDVVSEPTNVAVNSSDSIGIPVRGTSTLVPVAGSNYARGTVVVQGRKLQARADITAEVNGRTATAAVKVVQQPPETGAPIEIKIVEEDFGNFRAQWAFHERKPNLLLISARHKSISRYLGPSPEFHGQNSPVFRLLLAEIVAESICRKSLQLECRERSADFRFADLADDAVIADTVLAHLHRRLRDFVADAHAIMLSDAEVRKVLEE
jgi:hypothetical protein